MTGPDSEGLQAAQWHPFRSREDWLRDQHAKYHDEPGNLLGRDDCEWQRCAFWDAASHVLDALTDSSPVVPSVGAVPVEVPEEFVAEVGALFAESSTAEAPLDFTDEARELLSRIAARLRAERDAHWRQRLADLQAEIVKIMEAQERRIARVRAEERQRTLRELAATAESDGEHFIVGWLNAVEDGDELAAHRLAAGSAVPVATPTEPVDWYRGTPEQVAVERAEVEAAEARYAAEQDGQR